MSLENFNTKEEPKPNDQEVAGPSSNIEEYYKMFDKQAEQRNAYRKWYQKLLGAGKVERTGVIEDRTELYDKALDLELSSGNSKSIAEAIGKIEDREEFKLKSSEKIEQEEFAKRKLLIVANSLDENNFSLTSEKAWALLSKIEKSEKIDDATKEGFKQKLDQLVTGKANDLLLGKEYENFVSIIERLSSIKKFSTEDFKNISPEILKSGELTEVVKQNAIEKSTFGPRSFVSSREKFTKIGILSEKEINEIPEVIQNVKNYIKEYPGDSRLFTVRRDLWVKTGVISVEDANKLPEIIQGAKEYITEYSNDPRLFVVRRDICVQAGVISKEEANELPEIVAGMKNYITEYANDPRLFTVHRDIVVNTGVITLENANNFSEIKNGLKNYATEYKDDKRLFEVRKNIVVKTGVLTAEEIDS